VTPPANGAVVAITGASSGIGAACARAFADAGLAVSLAARRTDRLHEVASAITAAGGRALPVAADVTSEADMRSFVTRTLAAFGGLDALICNAGVGYHGTLDETSAAQMRRLLDVNFMGTFHATRAVLPYFEQQGHGHLFIVSSIVGRRGTPGYAGYSASKFAQVGFGEALRAELSGSRIHVTLVFPVSTMTEFRDVMRRDYGVTVTGRGPQQSPEAVAAAMVRALRRPRREIYPYRWARLLVLLNAIAPGLADRVTARFGRRRATHPAQR
jgi:short-subunit dehydrogenase